MIVYCLIALIGCAMSATSLVFDNQVVRRSTTMTRFGGGPIRGELIPTLLDMMVSSDTPVAAINEVICVIAVENSRFMSDVSIQYLYQQVVGAWSIRYPIRSNYNRKITISKENKLVRQNNKWKLSGFDGEGECDVLYVNNKYLFLTKSNKYLFLEKV